MSTRVFFIGNSYTARNDLPSLITKLAAAGTPPKSVETGTSIASGMGLKYHWNKGEALKALHDSNWDFVSLQEQSNLPWKSRAKMHESVRLFDGEIKKRGSRTVLYLTWARQDAPERQEEITEAYMSIAREVGAIVAPVGIAWQSALAERPDLILHDADQSHPAISGSYLAACVFYATLFGESPVGSTAEIAGLSPELRADLQKIAWKTVQEQL